MSEAGSPTTGKLSYLQVTEAFHLYDLDNNGNIDVEEFMLAMKALRCDCSVEEATQMISDAGCIDTGMDINKFKEVLTKRYGIEVNNEGIAAKVFHNVAVKRIKMTFAFFLAIYTMFSLMFAFREASREELRLTPKPPSDRCITFFETVKDFAKAHSSTTDVLYDIRRDEALVRICSDLSNETVIDAIGARYWYTPVGELGCDVRDPIKRRLFEDQCSPPADMNCSEVLHIPPVPDGLTWSHSFLRVAGTSADQNGTECAIDVRPVQGIKPCTRSYVGSFHTKARNLSLFMLFLALVPFVVFLVQCSILVHFTIHTFPKKHHKRVAYALQGIPGPIFYFFFVCVKKKDISVLDHLVMSRWQWGALLIQGLIEGLAAPTVHVYGCSLDRFVTSLLLVIFKLFKLSWDSASYWTSRRRIAAREMLELSEELVPTATSTPALLPVYVDSGIYQPPVLRSTSGSEEHHSLPPCLSFIPAKVDGPDFDCL